jgi:hypothetical protein
VEVGEGGSDTSEGGGSIFSLVDFWCLYCLKLLWIFLAAQFSISSSLTATATGKKEFDDFFLHAITNSSDFFTNLFHEFFPQIFLSR